MLIQTGTHVTFQSSRQRRRPRLERIPEEPDHARSRRSPVKIDDRAGPRGGPEREVLVQKAQVVVPGLECVMVVGFAQPPTHFPIVVNENLGIDPRAPADIQFGPPAPIRIDRAYDECYHRTNVCRRSVTRTGARDVAPIGTISTIRRSDGCNRNFPSARAPLSRRFSDRNSLSGKNAAPRRTPDTCCRAESPDGGRFSR